MNPYPTKRELKINDRADELLAEQKTASEAFFAAAHAFKTQIEALAFPLGCPAIGWDTEDIIATCDDWLNDRPEMELQDAAIDAANAENEGV